VGTAADLAGLELAARADDAHRQVLADELAERGDPRGELIHVQLRLAAPGGESPALRARERELLQRHGQGWIRPLQEIVAERRGHAMFGFRGGFVEDVAIDCAIAAESLPRLVALAPIKRVALRGATRDHLPRLAQVAELGKLVLLDLSGTFLDARVLGLFLEGAGPRLAALEGLILQRNLLGPQAATALASARGLAALRDLDLRHNSLGLPGVEALTRPGVLPALRRLGLSHNRVFARAPQVQYDWSGAVLGEVRDPEEGPAELASRFAGRAELQIF
jgi:uncharacterized protein (TIGR02996 family)